MMIYAMQVMTGEEQAVVKRLQRDRLAGIVPREIIAERRGGKVLHIERPLLPGYVFLQTEEPIWPCDYYAATTANGVIRMLGMTAGKPTPMTGDDVARLMVLANGGEPIGISHGILEGGKVRITDGWLMGKAEMIEAVHPRQMRAVVRTTLMDQPRRLRVGLIIEK